MPLFAFQEDVVPASACLVLCQKLHFFTGNASTVVVARILSEAGEFENAEVRCLGYCRTDYVHEHGIRISKNNYFHEENTAWLSVWPTDLSCFPWDSCQWVLSRSPLIGEDAVWPVITRENMKLKILILLAPDANGLLGRVATIEAQGEWRRPCSRIKVLFEVCMCHTYLIIRFSCTCIPLSACLRGCVSLCTCNVCAKFQNKICFISEWQDGDQLKMFRCDRVLRANLTPAYHQPCVRLR